MHLEGTVTFGYRPGLCERKTLEEFKAFATAVTVEPVECMWSWGKGWENQWHGVDLAYQTLARFGRPPEEYTTVTKSRVDLRYEDLDLEDIWKRYSASAAAKRAGGHFAVLGMSQGWDVHMVATPPLARAFSVYRSRPARTSSRVAAAPRRQRPLSSRQSRRRREPPRGLSTRQPRRRRDPASESPRDGRAVAARPVSADYPRGSRGVAATRPWTIHELRERR